LRDRDLPSDMGIPPTWRRPEPNFYLPPPVPYADRNLPSDGSDPERPDEMIFYERGDADLNPYPSLRTKPDAPGAITAKKGEPDWTLPDPPSLTERPEPEFILRPEPEFETTGTKPDDVEQYYDVFDEEEPVLDDIADEGTEEEPELEELEEEGTEDLPEIEDAPEIELPDEVDIEIEDAPEYDLPEVEDAPSGDAPEIDLPEIEDSPTVYSSTLLYTERILGSGTDDEDDTSEDDE
jgi:hypothetical protein